MAIEQNGTTEEPQPAAAAPATPIVADTANTSTVSVDSTNGEHDPYFEPVVTLPEVKTSTNEENEEPLYTERCKLFRFAADTSEWKERGTGNVKLLKNTSTGMVRLLMRQEKTLKVRANHYITPYMMLKPNVGSDRAFVWHSLLDFADEEAKKEMFAIRFANVDLASKFKAAFEDAVLYVTNSTDGLHLSDHEEDEDDEEENKENAGEEQTPNQKVSSEDVKKAEVDKEVVEGLDNLKVE